MKADTDRPIAASVAFGTGMTTAAAAATLMSATQIESLPLRVFLSAALGATTWIFGRATRTLMKELDDDAIIGRVVFPELDQEDTLYVDMRVMRDSEQGYTYHIDVVSINLDEVDPDDAF